MPARADSSRARRCPNGTSSSASSPRASRSKATKEAGVCSASRFTRDSAGWIRCSSASKSSRSPRGMTISPSATHRSGSSSFTAATTSGKYRVSGRSLRLPSSTSAPSRKTMQRKPSHFGSEYMPSPVGSVVEALASIGFTGGSRGRSMPAVKQPGPTGSGSAGVQPVSGEQHAVLLQYLQQPRPDDVGQGDVAEQPGLGADERGRDREVQLVDHPGDQRRPEQHRAALAGHLL